MMTTGSPSDTVTRLHARGVRLAKQLRPDGTMQGYDRARMFTVDIAAVSSLDDIAAVLTNLLPRSDLCVIRGTSIGTVPLFGARRLLHPDPETGELPDPLRFAQDGV